MLPSGQDPQVVISLCPYLVHTAIPDRQLTAVAFAVQGLPAACAVLTRPPAKIASGTARVDFLRNERRESFDVAFMRAYFF